MKVIKRYANRKFYSKYDSKYIKIEDIANMVKNGDQVSILDKETNNDITHEALSYFGFSKSDQKEYVMD